MAKGKFLCADIVKLYCEISDTFVTHAGRVHDVMMQTAGHRMVSLTVTFSRLSNVDLSLNDQAFKKKIYIYICMYYV